MRHCWSGRCINASTANCCQKSATGPRPHRAWLVLERREVSVCVTHPGFAVDLILHADLAYFYRVWFGEISYDTGLRSHAITVEGLPRLTRPLSDPEWYFGWLSGLN